MAGARAIAVGEMGKYKLEFLLVESVEFSDRLNFGCNR